MAFIPVMVMVRIRSDTTFRPGGGHVPAAHQVVICRAFVCNIPARTPAKIRVRPDWYSLSTARCAPASRQ